MIVQFETSGGVGPRPVALPSPAEIAAKSQQAVDAAMDTIRDMGQRFIDVVHALPRPPTEVELDFGITFDMEAGAVVAKTTAGASLTVKLTWKSDPAAHAATAT